MGEEPTLAFLKRFFSFGYFLLWHLYCGRFMKRPYTILKIVLPSLFLIVPTKFRRKKCRYRERLEYRSDR